MTNQPIESVKRHHQTNDPAVQEYIRKTPRSRSRIGSRKWSLMLMDESVKLASTHGYKLASEMTGVGIWSIKKHAVSLKRRNKQSADVEKEWRGKKYSAQKIKGVIERGLKMHRAGLGSVIKCIRKAAILEKVNPDYAYCCYNKGYIVTDI